MDFQIFGSNIKSGQDLLSRQLRNIILTRSKVAKNAGKKMTKVLVMTPVLCGHHGDSTRPGFTTGLRWIHGRILSNCASHVMSMYTLQSGKSVNSDTVRS